MTSTNPILPREGPRDECGVFGVYAPESDVARLVDQLHAEFPGCIRGVEQKELSPGDDPLPPGLSGVQVTRAR